MYKNERLLGAVLGRILKVEEETLSAMNEGRIEHEPSITDRFLAYMESNLHRERIPGLHWTAKTLTSIGKVSQEVLHGADFLGVFDLRLPGYRVRKGFLAQAKRLEPDQIMARKDLANLRKQCVSMLNRSPVSYVFIYSWEKGIRVVSAQDIVAAVNLKNPLDLTTWPLQEFYKAHFECFIGDFRISSATPGALEELMLDYRARSGIVISISQNNSEIPQNRFG